MTDLDTSRAAAEAAAEYERLLDLRALSTWSLDRQREHAADRAGYEAALAAFQAALRSQHIEGDGWLSARRRARKVERHLRALVRAARISESAAERLRTAYADHVRAVEALPGQRAARQQRRLSRREAVAEVTAKSLHKTAAKTAAFQAESTEGGGQRPSSSSAEPQVRGLADLWERGA